MYGVPVCTLYGLVTTLNRPCSFHFPSRFLFFFCFHIVTLFILQIIICIGALNETHHLQILASFIVLLWVFCCDFLQWISFSFFFLVASLILKTQSCVNSALNKTWQPPELQQVVCFVLWAISQVNFENNLALYSMSLFLRWLGVQSIKYPKSVNKNKKTRQ